MIRITIKITIAVVRPPGTSSFFVDTRKTFELVYVVLKTDENN